MDECKPLLVGSGLINSTPTKGGAPLTRYWDAEEELRAAAAGP
jgi:hypothetical protein